MLALARNSSPSGAEPPPEPTMAEASLDTDLCLRVIDRHGLRQDDLARESGVASSQLSRYLSGQFLMPFRVWAAVWRLTRDAELLSILATADRVVVPIDRAALPLESGIRDQAPGMSPIPDPRSPAPPQRRNITTPKPFFPARIGGRVDEVA